MKDTARTQPLRINKAIAKRPSIMRARIKRAITGSLTTFAIVIVLGVLGYTGHVLLMRFLTQPDFTIRKVRVVHNTTITAQEVMRIAQVKPKMNIYATALEPMVSRLERHPDIKSVTISKQHPDTLVINIAERDPIAVIVSKGLQLDIPIDADGVMLSEHKMQYALHLPKIVGLDAVRYQPGATVSDPRVPVAMRFVDALRRMPQNTFLEIRKISLAQKNDIILQTASIEEIHLGTVFSIDAVMRLAATVNDLRFRRINARKIDLRFADVAVTPCVL